MSKTWHRNSILTTRIHQRHKTALIPHWTLIHRQWQRQRCCLDKWCKCCYWFHQCNINLQKVRFHIYILCVDYLWKSCHNEQFFVLKFPLLLEGFFMSKTKPRQNICNSKDFQYTLLKVKAEKLLLCVYSLKIALVRKQWNISKRWYTQNPIK